MGTHLPLRTRIDTGFDRFWPKYQIPGINPPEYAKMYRTANTTKAGTPMRYLEPDTTHIIDGLKCTDEGDSFRLTFRWPEGIQQVHIYKKEENCEAPSSGPARLLTLQEYRRQSGFTDKKSPGTFTYMVCPFVRTDGEDFYYPQPDNRHMATVTGRVEIKYQINCQQNWRGQKLHDIIMSSGYDIPPDTICCVKKENSPPTGPHDGTVYYVHDAITKGEPLVRQVQTTKDEYICLYISDPARQIYKMTLV